MVQEIASLSSMSSGIRVVRKKKFREIYLGATIFGHEPSPTYSTGVRHGHPYSEANYSRGVSIKEGERASTYFEQKKVGKGRNGGRRPSRTFVGIRLGVSLRLRAKERS